MNTDNLVDAELAAARKILELIHSGPDDFDDFDYIEGLRDGGPRE